MESVIAVVVIAALIGVSVLLGYLRTQATRALNRAVFERGKHQRGQATTKEAIEFTAPVPASTVITAVRDRLQLSTTTPTAFLAALHLIENKPGLLVFGFGTKLQLTFRSALASDDRPDGSSSTTYQVLNWVEGDGIVRGIPEMELLANTVRAVAAELGGSYGTSTGAVPPPPASRATSIAPSPPRRFCENCGSSELGDRFCTACGQPLPA